jgi:DNA processing protein
MSELIYTIALTFVSGIGDVLGKKLINYCGSAEAVFRDHRKMLRKIPRMGESLIAALGDREVMVRAEREMDYISRYGIQPVTFRDAAYPSRLRNCIDSPLLLYFKGNAAFNVTPVIGIVGTRSATEYGKSACRALIEGLADLKPLIVSGLAYGIDSCAHRVAVEKGLPTIGVLGHGLDRIYPYTNRTLAEKMLPHGGLISDFPIGTKPDRENFPRRNRIIAGMCDAVIVVEAARTGGALITADIADSYNRDVFAVPGRINDPYSEGTNWLIRSNKAALVQSPDDIRFMMGWSDEKPPVAAQRKIFLELSPEEEKVVGVLSASGPTGIDDLTLAAGISTSKVAAALLNLEFEAIVKCLPGKVYSLQ